MAEREHFTFLMMGGWSLLVEAGVTAGLFRIAFSSVSPSVSLPLPPNTSRVVLMEEWRFTSQWTALILLRMSVVSLMSRWSAIMVSMSQSPNWRRPESCSRPLGARLGAQLTISSALSLRLNTVPILHNGGELQKNISLYRNYTGTKWTLFSGPRPHPFWAPLPLLDFWIAKHVRMSQYLSHFKSGIWGPDFCRGE